VVPVGVVLVELAPVGEDISSDLALLFFSTGLEALPDLLLLEDRVTVKVGSSEATDTNAGTSGFTKEEK
jgi:hypothetical protein